MIGGADGLPVEHLEERVTRWILLRPAQHRVLQNVRRPCRVCWGGAERNGEHVVLILPSNVQPLRPRASVIELDGRELEFIHGRHSERARV
jgi:hypothetical protein